MDNPVFAIDADPDGTGAHPRTATKTVYDAEGRVIEVDRGTTTLSTGGDFAALLTATTSYDPAGNKVKESAPSSLTQFSYDGLNRVVCTAVRMNRGATGAFGVLPADACTLSTATSYGPDRITENLYDAAGQLRQIIRGLGTAVQEVYASYKYSGNGKQVAVADADAGIAAGVANADALDASAAHAHQTNYAYDGFDRLVLTLYADGSGDQAAYDANGNAVTRTNRAGEIVAFAYDALNRVVSKALPLSGTIPADTVSWAYDLAGRIVSLSDTAGQSLANSYDSAGRIVSTASTFPGLAGAKAVSYQYDQGNNRTRLTWPDGYWVKYDYDASNRMISALENGTTALATFDYDQLGRPAWEQYGTGTPAAKVSFSWSNEGDLLTLGHALSGTASVSYTNGYTPAHQIASATLDNAAYRYVPPANGTDAYVPNVLNQYASVTPAGAATATAIGYDLKGNLTSDGTFAFAYDAENKLITAAKTGTAAAYAYDPLGRRDEKTVNGTSTYFLSADADEIAEYDGAGTLLRRYVPGPAIDRPIAMVDAAGTKTFFHQDKTGSVIAMSDAAGNKTEGPYTYDSYGNGAPYTGVPFKYTGRRLDPETGLYYYRARYYCAPCGRFLQTDAIGYADGINWYTYVGNDPTDKTDPSGLCDDVTGCNPEVAAVLNTPEARQGELIGAAIGGTAIVATGAVAAVGPEAAAVAVASGARSVAISSAVGGTVAGTVSAVKGNSAPQVATDAGKGAINSAITAIGGLIGGVKGKAAAVAGEVAGAFAGAKATGASNTDASISAGVAGVVGGAFQIIPGLSSSANTAASGASSTTLTILRALAKSGAKAELKSLFTPQHQQQQQSQSHVCTGSRIPTTGSCTGF